MPKKPGHNSTDYRMLTCRVEHDTVQRFNQLAGRMQAESGINVAVSDLIRRALTEYLRKHDR
jgi:hypothetical protein